MPVSEDANYSRLVALDRLPGVGDRCFVIDVWSRTGDDARGDWDPRGKPRLLDDVVNDNGQWHIYNCLVALRPWSRSRAWLSQARRSRRTQRDGLLNVRRVAGGDSDRDVTVDET